jgi:SOS response regulatory protein OraA/RecX
MTKIEIIPIAKNKLRRRGIPEEWLNETIRNPSQIVDVYGGRKVAQRKYMVEGREYLLRVVFEEKGSYYLVVTGYLTSQIERYWKEEKGED